MNFTVSTGLTGSTGETSISKSLRSMTLIAAKRVTASKVLAVARAALNLSPNCQKMAEYLAGFPGTPGLLAVMLSRDFLGQLHII